MTTLRTITTRRMKRRCMRRSRMLLRKNQLMTMGQGRGNPPTTTTLETRNSMTHCQRHQTRTTAVHRGRDQRCSGYQKEMDAEMAAMRAEGHRKELNCSTSTLQQGAPVDCPNNANSNAILPSHWNVYAGQGNGEMQRRPHWC